MIFLQFDFRKVFETFTKYKVKLFIYVKAVDQIFINKV